MKAHEGFFIVYVEDSTPFLKKFKTKKSQEAFLKKQLLKQDLANGTWIDLVFEGKLTYTDGSIN